MDPRAKPRALTRDVNTRLSTAEADPQALQSLFASRMRTAKPGAPAAAPAAVVQKHSYKK
ncbi:MAG: hypothetical protein Q8O91_00150 [Candidatus Aminicenantes bacterium]|nr:hypothetical protein [Candidatus Aminicenantes bacterium]